MEYLLDAVDKLKKGKAGGKSGILPEMLKATCGDNVFAEMLLKLFCIKYGRELSAKRLGAWTQS